MNHLISTVHWSHLSSPGLTKRQQTFDVHWPDSPSLGLTKEATNEQRHRGVDLFDSLAYALSLFVCCLLRQAKGRRLLPPSSSQETTKGIAKSQAILPHGVYVRLLSLSLNQGTTNPANARRRFAASLLSQGTTNAACARWRLSDTY